MDIKTKQLFKAVTLSLIGVILVVGVISFYNLNSTSIHNELVALYLLPKPEKLTELYFNDNANLPSSATKNQANVDTAPTLSFAFVVHNLETTDYQYVYEVSVNLNGTRHIIDSGKVLVKNNQYYSKNEKFNLMNVPGRQEVVVELTNKHQAIDFWVQLQ